MPNSKPSAVKYELVLFLFLRTRPIVLKISAQAAALTAQKNAQNSRQLDPRKPVADAAVTSAQFQEAFTKFGASSVLSSALIALFRFEYAESLEAFVVDACLYLQNQSH